MSLFFCLFSSVMKWCLYIYIYERWKKIMFALRMAIVCLPQFLSFYVADCLFSFPFPNLFSDRSQHACNCSCAKMSFPLCSLCVSSTAAVSTVAFLSPAFSQLASCGPPWISLRFASLMEHGYFFLISDSLLMHYILNLSRNLWPNQYKNSHHVLWLTPTSLTFLWNRGHVFQVLHFYMGSRDLNTGSFTWCKCFTPWVISPRWSVDYWS